MTESHSPAPRGLLDDFGQYDLLRDVLDLFPGIVLVCDAGARIVLANKWAEEEFGITKEGIEGLEPGRGVAVITGEGGENSFLAPLKRTLETGVEIKRREVALKSKLHLIPFKYIVTTRLIFKSARVAGAIGFYERHKRFRTVADYSALSLPTTAEQIETLYAFAEAIGARDNYTLGHSEKVAEYAVMIAEHLGLSQEEIELAYFCGIMHDIGKIGIPESILNKPGKLTPEEYKQIMQHPTKGATILSHINWLDKVLPVINCHHERYDGTGYPLGLAGEEIPLISRILAVADAFDAMTTDRCYRPALSLEEALSELKANAGKQFDPFIVSTFIQILEQFA